MSIQSLNLISGRASGEKKGTEVQTVSFGKKNIELRYLVKDQEPLLFWYSLRFDGKNYQIDVRRQSKPYPPNLETDPNRLCVVADWIQNMVS